MRTSKIVFVAILAVVVAAGVWAAEEAAKPHVVILATGGTIAGSAASQTQAGYDSGQVGVEVLISAVPQLAEVAEVTGEQVANVGSQNMNDEVWLKLAKRINELAKSPDVDGIVITHGTDTMEETAYFLNLVVKTDKPVVLTGSMRPSTALSADGPLNIFNAVAVAADPGASGRGVLVVANDSIHSGRDIIKSNTTHVETFLSPQRGLIGAVQYGETLYFRGPYAVHTSSSEFSVENVEKLPRVDIIYIHEDADGALIEAAVKAGAKGIVTAGVGNGNMTDAALQALAEAVTKGVVCVRSTRVPTGFVGRNVEIDDDEIGLVASYEHNPQKARVLLRLALLKTKSALEIQQFFSRY
jgi:L-asparaginase